ncbi:MAG: Fe(2+) transporter FeoB [Firmicutes bacterium]|nr:Fe(2+) transporter FeoB [Bacillota bacterium]
MLIFGAERNIMTMIVNISCTPAHSQVVIMRTSALRRRSKSMAKRQTQAAATTTRVVLVGNPNSGKSVIFNSLTGMYVDVSNYPGTTVEIAEARVGNRVYVDTPGVYGISAFNDEERVTRDVVLTADVILNVVNAVYLERDIFLTLQCIDMGLPVVVAVNMLDEAASQGLKVNLHLLSNLLGVPVVGTIAVLNKGFTELHAALEQPKTGIIGDYLRGAQGDLHAKLGSPAEVMLYLEDDKDIAKRHGLKPPGSREKSYLAKEEEGQCDSGAGGEGELQPDRFCRLPRETHAQAAHRLTAAPGNPVCHVPYPRRLHRRLDSGRNRRKHHARRL